MSWMCLRTNQGNVHVLPERDADHWMDFWCPCMPTRAYEWDPLGCSGRGAWIVTHNAWDGREHGELERAGREFNDSEGDTLLAWGAICEPARPKDRNRNERSEAGNGYL